MYSKFDIIFVLFQMTTFEDMYCRLARQAIDIIGQIRRRDDINLKIYFELEETIKDLRVCIRLGVRQNKSQVLLDSLQSLLFEQENGLAVFAEILNNNI